CTVAVKLVSATAGECEGQASVDVGAGGLSLQQVPASKLKTGRVEMIQFEVGNQTDKPLQQISVVYVLPEGIDLVEASNQGIYQPATRIVYWVLDLAPGKAQQLALKGIPNKTGEFPGEVFAKVPGVPDAKAPVVITVDNAADVAGLDNAGKTRRTS